MVALDESKRSLYALNWVLSNVVKPVGEEEEQSDSFVCLLHVNLPFQTYVYPAGPGLSLSYPFYCIFHLIIPNLYRICKFHKYCKILHLKLSFGILWIYLLYVMIVISKIKKKKSLL